MIFYDTSYHNSIIEKVSQAIIGLAGFLLTPKFYCYFLTSEKPAIKIYARSINTRFSYIFLFLLVLLFQ